ncbi:MAG: YbaN family protein [Pseudomonadota bacterium]
MGLRRGLWFAIGWIALALGAIGVVLPVLPTTPFIILAAFAFGASAPRLQARLEQHRVFGPIIADWQANGAIAPPFKVIAICMMAAVLGVSIATDLAGWIVIVQALCMAGAAAFILSRPNGPK